MQNDCTLLTKRCTQQSTSMCTHSHRAAEQPDLVHRRRRETNEGQSLSAAQVEHGIIFQLFQPTSGRCTYKSSVKSLSSYPEFPGERGESGVAQWYFLVELKPEKPITAAISSFTSKVKSSSAHLFFSLCFIFL